ncbi:MAG: TonB-dependent receptor [Desulfobacterales bacterium]|nr:TonB-dependent receptor [Desulfobacterales bacterium]
MKKYKLTLKKCIGIWSLSLLFLCAPAMAKTASPSADLGEMVVTATRSAQSADEVFADVEVVTARDLEGTTAHNLEDALKGIPGLDNRGSRSQSWWFTTNIRGVGGGKRILMMMDGVPLNSALTGFAYPLRTDLNAVEQVEVVKGSFSSLYGSNAMGGVINVISRSRKEEGVETHVHGYGGDYGFYDAGAALLGKKGKFSFSLDVSRQHFDNQYRRDDQLEYSYAPGTGFTKTHEEITGGEFNSDKVFARMDYHVDEDTEFTFTGNYALSCTENGMTKYQATARDLGDSDHGFYFLNLTGKTRVMDDLGLEMRVYTNYDRTESLREHIIKNPGFGAPFLFLFGSIDHWGRDTGMQIKGTRSLGDRHFLTAGVDYNFMQGYWKNAQEDGTVIDRVMDEDMQNLAGYVQDEISLTDDFTATLGLRYDVNSESENALSPKLGLFYRLNDWIRFRGSVGRSFRAPNLNELYTPTWMMIPGVPFESNPDLEPEKIWSYDLGTTITLPMDMELSFTGFYSKAKDLISNPIIMGVMKYENLDEVTTDGFEIGLSGDVTHWLGFHLNATYTHSVEEGFGRLDDVPLYQVNAGISTRHDLTSTLALTTSLDARYSDETLYRDTMTGSTITVDDYVVVDLAASLVYRERLKFKLALHNLTNVDYAIHGSNLGPRRYAWGGVEFTF